jgi:uncharacterized FlaG/YvyC family protein
VATVQPRSGKLSPPAGTTSPPVAAQTAGKAPASAEAQGSVTPVRATPAQSLEAVIANVNKAFNDSGKPTQFRLDPTSGNKVIQQINPATGEVVAQFQANEFPALASSLGISGLFVNSRV